MILERMLTIVLIDNILELDHEKNTNGSVNCVDVFYRIVPSNAIAFYEHYSNRHLQHGAYDTAGGDGGIELLLDGKQLTKELLIPFTRYPGDNSTMGIKLIHWLGCN